MAEAETWTFEDAIDFVLDSFGSERSARNVRNAKRAILASLNELPNKRNWTYYYRRYPVVTVAPYSTGTVTYDHTGGTHERQLTLSGGTWPAWAAFGTVNIDRNFYNVESRKSDTVLTLDSVTNPGADISSSSYQIFRDNYPLPDDYLAMDRLVDLTGVGLALTYVSPGDYHQAARIQRQLGMPTYFTVQRSLDERSKNALFFGPPPRQVRSYEFIYRGQPRPLRTERYATGNVTNSGVTITGAGTAFTQDHVGAVIRFSSNGNAPTSVVGNLQADDNQFSEQRTIVSVESATSLTINNAPTQSYSGAGFTISDPIDIEPAVMLVVFQRLAEYHMAVYEGHDPNKVAYRQRVADMAMRDAVSADQKVFGTNPQMSVGPIRIRDVATAVNPT